MRERESEKERERAHRLGYYEKNDDFLIEIDWQAKRID